MAKVKRLRLRFGQTVGFGVSYAMRETLEHLATAYDDLTVKGKKSAYLAVNGNMFAFVDDQGALCLRLSEAEKAAFNETHGASDVIQYNAVMRGYVRPPKSVIGDPAVLKELFDQSVSHARTLKPKPTKRSK